MGRSIFYPHPPKDEGFSKQGGFGFFLQRSPQNFNPSGKFFKAADKKRTQVQIPVIFRGVQIKNGTSQPMTRQWRTTWQKVQRKQPLY